MNTLQQRSFQCVAEGAMAYIVEENSNFGSGFFFGSDVNALALQFEQSLTHEVIRPQTMCHAAVHGTGVHQVGKRHLVNTTQPLIVGVADYLEHQWVIDTDETINRVVDDFSFETHVKAKVGF
jgi:hypothetical protein